MKAAFQLCAALFFAVARTSANDGFGGIGASGLEFSQTDKVAMVSEDLFISLKKIAVSYVFENASDEDVTGEVIFPLPPITLQDLVNMDMNLPEDRDRKDLVNFTVEVEGRSVTPEVDRRAVRLSDTPESAAPGTPVYGEDVTRLLENAGVPLTLDPQRLADAMEKIPAAALEKLVAAGLVKDFGAPAQGLDRYLFNWAISIRYHWNQTFPARSMLTVRHEYENYPPGGIWAWQHPATEEYQRDLAARYCIDEATSKALTRCKQAYEISYILRTANTWKGPIGDFKLTIDKGSPQNIISLCADGVEKTGPTTFVVKKKDYAPTGDLQILIGTPGIE